MMSMVVCGELEDEEKCVSCSRAAEIFQVTGNFCLKCCQRETHPNI
jgi:hypothetical protein